MTVHFSVVCDRFGDLTHAVLTSPGQSKVRKLGDLIKGDVSEIIDRARSEGAVFGIERNLAVNGESCKLAGVHDRDHTLIICADSSKEITDYYATLKREDSTNLEGDSFDQGVYDQITRLNNELINTQSDLAKINSRYSRDIERLGLTLANIGSGVIVLDGDGKVEFINEAAKAILRVDENVIGMPCEAIYRVSSDDEPRVSRNPDGDIKSATPARKKLKSFDNKELYIIDSINALGAHGKVIAFQDITPIEKLQENLWRSNEMLRLMSKVIRHDVLNHLTVVNGYIQLADPDSESEILDKAMTAALKAEEIIRQMKEMESMVMSKGELKPYILSQTVAKVMEGHGLEWSIEGDSSVLADPAIYSVLENLVSNAIRHGGTERIDFNISTDNGSVILKVIDEGTGIPDSIKEQLFQEGFSFGKAANTGLGLYLARMVVLRYGGEISVEDNEPHGAVFILRFRAPNQIVP